MLPYNHRALLLRPIDQLEENEKFSSFLHDSQFLTHESYQDITRRLEAKRNSLLQEERKKVVVILSREDSHNTIYNISLRRLRKGRNDRMDWTTTLCILWSYWI
jgi:broad specificity phosphatase PhoE